MPPVGPGPRPDDDLPVVTFDGTGIVMHPEALRPATPRPPTAAVGGRQQRPDRNVGGREPKPHDEILNCPACA